MSGDGQERLLDQKAVKFEVLLVCFFGVGVQGRSIVLFAIWS